VSSDLREATAAELLAAAGTGSAVLAAQDGRLRRVVVLRAVAYLADCPSCWSRCRWVSAFVAPLFENAFGDAVVSSTELPWTVVALPPCAACSPLGSFIREAFQAVSVA
jgi:hypothetical protein